MVLIETPFYHFIEGEYFSSPLELLVVNVLVLVLCLLYGVGVRRSPVSVRYDAKGFCLIIDGLDIFFVFVGFLSFFVYQGIWQVCYDLLPAGPEWLKVTVASVLMAILILQVILVARTAIRNIALGLAKKAKK
jgi:hypothetical protein